MLILMCASLVGFAKESRGADSSAAVEALEKWLEKSPAERGPLDRAPFAQVPLSAADAVRATDLLWADRCKTLQRERAAEWQDQRIALGPETLAFKTVWIGPAKSLPAGERSLWISLHGGGGAPPGVNDAQWKNQVALQQEYRPTSGLCVVPRAPGNTWDMWHKSPVDALLARLIEDAVVLAGVDPNRVYLWGYSAGGDGVYQLAPRTADRWAAVAMMAGHPNQVSPLGLRNLPFALQVGGRDDAYGRNQAAERFAKSLDDLQRDDPDGYPHFVKIHPEKGHWMDLADVPAIAWMEKFARQPWPRTVVWVPHPRGGSAFYWLSARPDELVLGQEIRAEIHDQVVKVTAPKAGAIRVRLNDTLLDLDRPVWIERDAQPKYQARALRTIETLSRTLDERGDRSFAFPAELLVSRPQENGSR